MLTATPTPAATATRPGVLPERPGSPVFLLHGFGSTPRVMRPIATHLRRAHGRETACIPVSSSRDQTVEPLHSAAFIFRRPGVHILAEQGDLFRPGIDQRLRFIDNRAPGPRNLGAARIGNDAIGAEFVAAFLDGQKGARRLFRAFRQCTEFGIGRHVRVERIFAAGRLGDELGQIVIGLRPDHDIDFARPARNFGPFGLGHATGPRRSSASSHRRGASGRYRNRPSPRPFREYGRC